MTLSPYYIQLVGNLISGVDRALFLPTSPFPSQLRELMTKSCDVKHYILEASLVNGGYKKSADFFCKGSECTYFRFCRPDGSLFRLTNSATVA